MASKYISAISITTIKAVILQTNLADYIFNPTQNNLQEIIQKPGKWKQQKNN